MPLVPVQPQDADDRNHGALPWAGGYVAHEQEKARKQNATMKAIEKVGDCIGYDRKTKPHSDAIRLLLGDETYGKVNFVDLGFSNRLYFGGSMKVTDAVYRHLRSFPRLQRLDFAGCKQITDAGLGELSGLSSLHELSLVDTLIRPC